MIIAFNRYFPENKTIKKALIEYSGIGEEMAQQVLDRVGISGNIKLGKISRSHLSQMKEMVESSYEVDTERRAIISQKIQRLFSNSCYRGLRHKLGLPCRGQRTHSNARTSRLLSSSIRNKK